MSAWKKTSDRLPPEGKYILGRHNRGTWIDDTDQENVDCVVVKLRKGLSIADREALADDDPRKDEYRSEDEDGNNEMPYCFESFGPDEFNGQEIHEWTEIPE